MADDCNVASCKHPSRWFGDPPRAEHKCECHSWNLTYEQRAGTTACHRDFPQYFADADSAR